MNDEEKAIEELKTMSAAELDMVQFDVVKLICQFKRCSRYTRARDYGISPIYYHRKMDIQWHDTNRRFFLCPAHFKFYNRMLKIYPHQHVIDKLIDVKKKSIM